MTSLVKLPCRSGYVLEVGRSRQHGNQADHQRVIYDHVGFSRLLTRLKPTRRGHSLFCAEINLLPLAPQLLREASSSSLATKGRAVGMTLLIPSIDLKDAAASPAFTCVFHQAGEGAQASQKSQEREEEKKEEDF